MTSSIRLVALLKFTLESVVVVVVYQTKFTKHDPRGDEKKNLSGVFLILRQTQIVDTEQVFIFMKSRQQNSPEGI